jgi:hypothetical protein
MKSGFNINLYEELTSTHATVQAILNSYSWTGTSQALELAGNK